jgi:alkylation response protein AidB-like acyl-CoA dehydrogenase
VNFSLTKEQKEIQKAAKEFAKGEFDKEIALDHERKHAFPFEIWRKACELGFVGLHFPEEYGGQGYGTFENVLVVEQFCRQDSGMGIAISLSDFASEIILRFGTEEQKEKYLLPLAEGQALSSGGFTEPDHGSDITLMNTTALREDGEYVINGSKTFITNGPIGDFVLLLCQSDLEAKPTYRGQSVIIVEKGAAGYEVSEIKEKMGIKMSPTGELTFDNVRVPISHLVGEENRGFYQVLEFFDESRIEIAAQAVGIAQGAFDRALEYVQKRRQFGKRLSDFQVTRHKLADMATRIETARLLVYKAAWNFDQGTVDPQLTSMAKMVAGRTAVQVADEAIQLLGGYGYMLEYEVERFYRDAKIMEIYEGTREIQKNTIASALLGRL